MQLVFQIMLLTWKKSCLPNQLFKVKLESHYSRCSRPEVFCKKRVLRIFAWFTKKHLCWSLFLIKLPDLQAFNFIKMKLQHRFFLVKFAKFLSAPFLQNTSVQLLLTFKCCMQCVIRVNFGTFTVSHISDRHAPSCKVFNLLLNGLTDLTDWLIEHANTTIENLWLIGF